MQVLNRKKTIGTVPQARGRHAEKVEISKAHTGSADKLVYEMMVPAKYTSESLVVEWKFPAMGVKGAWTSNNILDKRFRTDWEMPALKSSISTDAPIVCLFGHDDENVVTVACSDLVRPIHIEASLREEDNHFYFKFHFFTDTSVVEDYHAILLIERSSGHFSDVLQEAASWIVAENQIPVRVTPPLAKEPLYSTWYSFHQNLDEAELLEECRLSKELGYELIIIDDGWQTMDDGRGYDYTGDWNPDRIPEMRRFTDQVHAQGMGIMLWYSVPFCGKKSKAYSKFRGKFLTENHYWAPVFDPRFPEVRRYLVTQYSKALLDWNLDGFKLDFIDDFKVYPDTEMKVLGDRDTLSVGLGTEKLIQEIAAALLQIKPDVLIEFRQQYINPALRQLGNMFRAFDCPNDSLMNRVRTTDVKLLCGSNAVHSDMFTWHANEPVEVAALQFTSIMFSVPQLSVRVKERSADEIRMIRFYTEYWKENRQVLLDGNFKAYKPLSNYPYLSASDDHAVIYGLYDDHVLPVDTSMDSIHVINGKMTDTVVLKLSDTGADWSRKVVDCKGDCVMQDVVRLDTTLYGMECPPNGIIFLMKIPRT